MSKAALMATSLRPTIVIYASLLALLALTAQPRAQAVQAGTISTAQPAWMPVRQAT